MNIVFLFLTRADLAAIPNIPGWLNEQPKIESLLAFCNPHLAIDPSPHQISLEDRIVAFSKAPPVPAQPAETDDPAQERLTLELELQKRWMQIPRIVMIEQLEKIFSPIGMSAKAGLTILNESFQADRLPELLTKLRPAWPSAIPLGSYVLVFPNQIPPKRAPGRPPGPQVDPAKRARMLANMEKARAARGKKKETVAA